MLIGQLGFPSSSTTTRGPSNIPPVRRRVQTSTLSSPPKSIKCPSSITDDVQETKVRGSSPRVESQGRWRIVEKQSALIQGQRQMLNRLSDSPQVRRACVLLAYAAKSSSILRSWT